MAITQDFRQKQASKQLKNKIMEMKITEKERELIIKALKSQISLNNKAKEMVSLYEVYEMIEKNNEELDNLIKRLAL